MITPSTCTNGSPSTSGTRPASMLHWLFMRGNRALSCDVHVSGRQRYEVHVTPLWDGEPPVCKFFDRPMDAVRRHAEIAFFLRESGWLLADRAILSSAA